MVKRISLVVVAFSVFSFLSGFAFAQSDALKNVETLMLKEAYAQAARECQRLLTHHHQAAIKSKAHYLLGICLLKEGKFAQARKNFNIVLRRFPRSKFCDDASLSAADSYFLAGEYNQAITEYERFLQNFPHSQLTTIARKQLGECRQGKPDAGSYFSVQVGCFAKKRNAERLREELINGGRRAYILKKAGERLYRVRVGKFDTRAQAKILERRLKAEGYTTKICP